jgi:hypothetical protein
MVQETRGSWSDREVDTFWKYSLIFFDHNFPLSKVRVDQNNIQNNLFSLEIYLLARPQVTSVWKQIAQQSTWT